MSLKKIILFMFCAITVSCASLFGVQHSKFTSEKIEIGMSKSDFLKLFGEPYAKEMLTDIQNRPVEHLLYQESLYDLEWYTLTTAFVFQGGKLVGQKVFGKEYVNRENHRKPNH